MNFDLSNALACRSWQHQTPQLCALPSAVCSSGSYGQDCSESCGHCQNNSACDVVSGACNGCDEGFQPPLCKPGSYYAVFIL